MATSRMRSGLVRGILACAVLASVPVMAAEPAAEPSAGSGPSCSGPLEAGAEVTCTVDVGGVSREFLLHVSERFRGRKTALIVDLHGTGSTNRAEEAISGWRALSDEQTFLVAYPQALSNRGSTQWNAGDCCEEAVMADDLGFMRRIVESLQAAPELKIDAKRVFATGLSSGGVMAHFIGCRAADVFRGIAPVSFPLSADLDCAPSQPIGMIEFHAPTDRRRSFSGFTVRRPAPLTDTRFLSVMDSASRWAQLDQCDTKVRNLLSVGQSQCVKFKGCDKGGQVAVCAIDGARQPLGGHDLYRNDDSVSIAGTAWAFFKSL